MVETGRGSRQTHPDGARRIGPVAPDTQLSLDVVLGSGLATRIEPSHALLKHASKHGLRAHVDEPLGRVVLEGAASDFDAAFGIELQRYSHGDREYRAHDGDLVWPAPLADAGLCAAGLDTRAVPAEPPALHGVPEARAPVQTVPQLAALYDFPKSTGAGQHIAILILGGGFSGEDLKTYFESLDLAVPEIEVVCVGDAVNDPVPSAQLGEILLSYGAGQSGPPLPRPSAARPPRWDESAAGDSRPVHPGAPVWTLEGLMDVEIAGAAAPGAKITVYVSEGDAASIARAVRRAVDDGADVVSCSFGEVESKYSNDELAVMERSFDHAAASRVTVLASSGDRGSTPSGGTELCVSYPASSTWVLAVGGTRPQVGDGSLLSENVWNEESFGARGATGGGFSSFAAPEWQKTAAATWAHSGRGVPDVAANASRGAGSWLWVGGVNTATAGTSAAAPLWAALVARLNEALNTRVGHLSPLLYRPDVSAAFRSVVDGDNKIDPKAAGWVARAGWNPCTGLGGPRGTALLGALRGCYPSSEVGPKG